MSYKSQKHSSDEKKPEKVLLKSLETPEEKRLRRFAKKELKQKKLKEEIGWDEEYMGYSNSSNPFGDNNLTNSFVWKRKLEKEGLHKLSKEDIERRNKLKLEQNKLELTKVKLRRIEREKERENREEELTKIQRQKEAAQFREWEKQEDSFHLQQAKLRSRIRIEEGRAKPIDLLARYINSEEEDFTVEMHEPYVYLNGLKKGDLEDLQEDIKVYKSIEDGKNVNYWEDLMVIVEDEIHKVTEKTDADRRQSINNAVENEIVAVFKGKTPKQLQAIYRDIKHKTSQEGVDTGYWETLLSRLNSHMAKARLRERHEENLRKKLFKLKEEQGVQKTAPLFPCVTGEKISSDPDPKEPIFKKPSSDEREPRSPIPSTSSAPVEEGQSDQESSEENLESINKSPSEVSKTIGEPYDSGRYSPVLLKYNKLEPCVLLTDPDEDEIRILYMQNRLSKQEDYNAFASLEDKEFVKIARKGMDADEAMFSVEAPVGDKNYFWSDKYRPRKPRYFNRVHTGFEWNKYNQTHYDLENPPPKIVQGYKFNIFYPDLIDKTKTPEYSLSPCGDNKDFAILKFAAGPPYEIIAFKIVNREWEYSYKKGFRCQFHNNIFQLYFHFKRYRYRR